MEERGRSWEDRTPWHRMRIGSPTGGRVMEPLRHSDVFKLRTSTLFFVPRLVPQPLRPFHKSHIVPMML